VLESGRNAGPGRDRRIAVEGDACGSREQRPGGAVAAAAALGISRWANRGPEGPLEGAGPMELLVKQVRRNDGYDGGGAGGG
jgi:hypothetical protein